MAKLKLTDILLKEIGKDRFEKKMTRADILGKYHISKATFITAMKKGVKLWYWNDEERYDVIRENISLRFERMKRKYGEKKLRVMFFEAWSKGAGKSHEKLVENAKKGGKKTQENYPYVQGNLRYAQKYGRYPRCKYKGIEFQSKGEMKLAIMLYKSGALKKIREGENFQVDFGVKRADFFINGIIIEYHPIPKGFNEDYYGNNYKDERINYLKSIGYDGKVYFIEKEGLEFRRLDYGVSDEAAEIKGLEKKQKSINSFF